jgi:NADPH2:quinone reductase
MRAVVIEHFGGVEALHLRNVERPPVGPRQVLVRVLASGTNPVDAAVRSAGTWAGIELPAVIGYEASGVVQEAGSCVTDLASGDDVFFASEIFGNRWGTYAEYCVVEADVVARKPERLSHVEAAAVPLAGGTAWEAVVRRLAVRPGESILIHGGAGGVGHFAVQIAKASGAFVIATASTDHQDFLRELGTDVPLDYRTEDVIARTLEVTDGEGVDTTLDCVGRRLLQASMEATRPFGRMATIVALPDDLADAYLQNLTIHGIFLTRERRRLEELARLLERGQVRPVVDQVLPLEEARRAHERLESRHGRGKVVLQVADVDTAPAP